ncbi:MAG: cytochrome P450 [Pseudomonadales bacterium]|nr:cytochrome P450 [Pseudomonadales bacterium]
MSAALIDEVDTMRGKDPYSIPLADYDVAQPALFQSDEFWPFFDRMRKEEPVHYCKESAYGPYWSVTRFEDIMAIEANNEVYSSASGISVQQVATEDFPIEMFIAMDEPGHAQQRKTVQGVVAPTNLATLEPVIRQRAGAILDALPVGETFDWVDKVSIELTTQMLATLFDFPFEERRKLTYWSDVATTTPGPNGLVGSVEERREVLLGCLEAFTKLWNERVNAEPTNDLISMLAHGEATRNMQPYEFLGNLMLLIIGGNDTTRNSITGGVIALNKNPSQYEKLRQDHSLIGTMVPEIIRWQTPLTSMARTALEDTDLGDKKIKKGDKVIMWYVSGNRDETVIEKPYDFIIDRERPRHHLSFGFGVHRCMGNRLAEMQLRIVWEEIMKRFNTVEVMGEPVRNHSVLIKGYSSLPVQLHPLKA